MIAVPHYVSPEEYLALEQQSQIRHEYRQGLVYAMAGGTDNHDSITVNLLTLLNMHLRDTDCRVHSGNVKVNYAKAFYYYPDAFVTCDERDRGDRDLKRYPKLIAEVLSPSTEAFDRDITFQDYQQIDSLEEYVLIDQEQSRVECRRRQADGTWHTVVYGEGETVTLTSVNLHCAIEELYRGVEG